MAASPYSRIFVALERIIAISGSSIHVLNLATGEVISSKSNDTGESCQGTALAPKGPIVAAAINEESTYMLTVGENKILRVWRLPNLELVNERELPKRPTGLAFTRDSQTILVSDKFGDMFSYALNYVPPTQAPIRDEFSSNENPSNGELILGHASPLNAFLLSHDEKYIITADRDEHIRVSWYPQGYNVEMYCLGHRRYVSAIHIPTFASDVLISGGGDPSLKIWNWMSGQCTADIQIWEMIEPFVTVKSGKRRRGEDEGYDEGDSTQKRKGKGKKSKKRAAKKAARAGKDNATKHEETEKNSVGEGNEAEYKEEDTAEIVEETVLVVSKIGSVQRGDMKFVIFSAVGVTALFGFQFPTGPVIHLDFKHPVIDFAPDKDGKIWISLDTRYTTQGTAFEASSPVRIVEFVESGQLEEVTSTGNQSLLSALNDKATAASGKSLDFYADLKGMPKWSEPSVKVVGKEDDYDDATESVASSTVLKSLTRREEARMKNKKNVLTKVQKLGEKEKLGTIRSFEEIESVDGDAERQTKRARSVLENTHHADMDLQS